MRGENRRVVFIIISLLMTLAVTVNTKKDKIGFVYELVRHGARAPVVP